MIKKAIQIKKFFFYNIKPKIDKNISNKLIT